MNMLFIYVEKYAMKVTLCKAMYLRHLGLLQIYSATWVKNGLIPILRSRVGFINSPNYHQSGPGLMQKL